MATQLSAVMDILKFSLFIFLLGGIFQQSAAEEVKKRDCSNSCIFTRKCSPYYEDLVWVVIDNVCRVFKNGCLLAKENCDRVNQCLPGLCAEISQCSLFFNNNFSVEVQPTSMEKCKEFCGKRCARNGPMICAWFPYTDCCGNNQDYYYSFGNLCTLNNYACENAQGKSENIFSTMLN
ncbi:hypothetical protein KR009_009399 [Drosophila setifemur]|nr:hypothetical protein KR009_002089 [Drosophila setifemur]KAH8385192.1 hypothetical protein KR009_009399 [Drosophila setifemur]